MRKQNPKPIGQQKQQETFELPVKCPKCQEVGLVLMYDYGHNEINLVCEMREDVKGRFIEGCHEIVFKHPLSEHEYYSLCKQPLAREHYFIMESIA